MTPIADRWSPCVVTWPVWDRRHEWHWILPAGAKQNGWLPTKNWRKILHTERSGYWTPLSLSNFETNWQNWQTDLIQLTIFRAQSSLVVSGTGPLSALRTRERAARRRSDGPLERWLMKSRTFLPNMSNETMACQWYANDMPMIHMAHMACGILSRFDPAFILHILFHVISKRQDIDKDASRLRTMCWTQLL